MNISLIGAGNMGSAFYRGLRDTVPEDQLAICDPDQGKLDALGAKRASTDANEILDDADIVLFAVKPQAFEQCMESITVDLSKKIIVSIMAGITIARIQDVTHASKVVRTMPNLGVQVGMGVTGWVATPEVTDGERQFVGTALASLGPAIALDDEAMIDAITPLSGSGPAYFFLLTELLQKNAEAMGFSESDARTIAEATLKASAQLMDANDMTAMQWREAVTSKGGVTAAALESMDAAGIEAIFAEAMQKAHKRSMELNG